MRTLLFATMLLAPLAWAHEPGGDLRGEILSPYLDQVDTGFFALVESVAPGAIPNGAFYYTINGVVGGSCFILEGVNPFPGLPTEPHFSTTPEFDLKFTGGEYGNGPGDEAGTVPGDGGMVIILVYGLPKSEFILHWC